MSNDITPILSPSPSVDQARVDADGDEILTTDSLFGHHGLIAPILNKKEEKEKTKYDEYVEREAHTPTLSVTNLEKLSALIESLCSQSYFTSHQHTLLTQMISSRLASHSLHEASQFFNHSQNIEQLKLAWEQAMLAYAEQRWEHLFQECSTADGKKISKAERANLGISKASLVYGEVSFESLGRVLWGAHVVLPTNGKFVDLGSGTGRAVFAADLLHTWSSLVGIEILSGLYQASEEIAVRWRTEKEKQVSDPTTIPHLQFHKGSFLEIDWSDADLVFANSTCFDEALMNEIAVCGQKLKVGTYVITLTKRLSSPYFKLINSTQYTMSWGYATVHVHIRIDPDPSLLLQHHATLLTTVTPAQTSR